MWRCEAWFGLAMCVAMGLCVVLLGVLWFVLLCVSVCAAISEKWLDIKYKYGQKNTSGDVL